MFAINENNNKSNYRKYQMWEEEKLCYKYKLMLPSMKIIRNLIIENT